MNATDTLHVLGIGASAGGLEAITQLIAPLSPELPCAYVVLQHLSPKHRSMMVEILARETTLNIREASHNEPLRAGILYVVPSNYNAHIKEGRLQLSVAAPEIVPKPSINQFFISLAAELGENALGILLSGTGSDGVAGLRALQASGGYTLAQSPSTAKYEGMPQAAIDAGVVDEVLAPAALAARLPALLHLTGRRDFPPEALFDELLERLRTHANADFSGYKNATLIRRLRRRELATGNPDLASYLRWTEQHPEELALLARELLISVTAFFRDTEAFTALGAQIRELCARKTGSDEIRIWVAGCATGEEAYSIAILVADALGERLSRHRIQIFATDVDEEALNIARRGIYPGAALGRLSPETLARHFHKVNHAYEVSKHLRDLLVFAHHNLVSDPPFLRLDLVSCRNVLIYFDTPLQGRVLQTFHFGLKSDGLLFLGRSESVTQTEADFAPINRRERLFRKVGDGNRPTGIGTLPALRPAEQRSDPKPELLLESLVNHLQLTALLCDTEGQILHTVGVIDRLLQFPQGKARLNLADATLPALRAELLTLVHRCLQTGQTQRGRKRKHGRIWLRLHVEPTGSTHNLLLIVRIPERGGSNDAAAGPAHDQAMEEELNATREHLQSLVEEMATNNEEMQALNEEVQASNEELQATNEELEAANEELQASNQELISLNEELNLKSSEMQGLAAEYAHLYDALPFPILVFDRQARLLRFNGPAARRFDLRPLLVLQPLEQIKTLADEPGLKEAVHEVRQSGERQEAQIQRDGRTLRLSVTPGLDPAGQVATLVLSLVDITDLTQALARLGTSQLQLNALMERTRVIFAMKTPDGCYQYANRRFLDYFGLGDDYLGKTDFQLLQPQLAADLWSMDVNALRNRQPMSREHSFSTREGRRHLKSTHQPLFAEDGKLSAFIIEADDVTDSRRAEEQLRITARVFNQAGEAIVVTDEKGIIQTVNRAFTSITGYKHDEASGQRMSMLQSGRHNAEFYQLMWQTLGREGSWQGEIWNRRKNGEIYPEWLTINRIDNHKGETEHYVAVFSDITQIKDSQRKAEYLATHDSLTGLPNRALFHDHLHHALAQARRKQGRIALLFIDLDNFKTINDTLGHDVGDNILKQASGRLRTLVRDVDTLCRLGGDEFTAVLLDCDADGADRVARRIVNELSAAFEVGERRLFVSASIGVSFYPDDGNDSAELIKKADSAMYRAKEQGRNRFEFFKPELHVRLLKQAALERGLREAMRAGHMYLVFQPKYALKGDRLLMGAEALLRWNDPELGQVSPSEFIPVAENCGLIADLDRMVQDQLVDQLAAWRALGLQPPPIAFNASPRSLREPDFAQYLLTRTDEAGLEREQIQLEITEGALLDSNSPHVLANVDTLHRAGIRVAVDDFGTGYSSLSYLKRLPIDELKIDKSFVDGLGQDREDEAITQAVLGLARALDLTTIAEGIETGIQLDWLVQHGCTMGQGHYLRAPVKAETFEDLIARTLS